MLEDCKACQMSALEHITDEALLAGYLDEVRRLSGNPTLTHDEAVEWLQRQKVNPPYSGAQEG